VADHHSKYSCLQKVIRAFEAAVPLLGYCHPSKSIRGGSKAGNLPFFIGRGVVPLN